MKNRVISTNKLVTLSLLVLLSALVSKAQANLWATAYYAGWKQGWSNNGHLPAQEIDYDAVTHIVHFSLVPNADGTLDPDANSITQTNSTELLSRAHAAGKKVIISVGGWGSDTGFRGATSLLNRTLFVTNLVTFMTLRGYDGIDIDWEVLQASDAIQYVAFINLLRTALNVIQPRPLLTAAVGGQPSILSQVHSQFDQINIMTYDMSGAWPGWVTWHNAPIYDGGYRFPATNGLVPSINGSVESFLAAGVPASKIGIGIDFYGYVWSGGDGTPTGGATAPRQGWNSAPAVQDNIPYSIIMSSYFQQPYYRWDDVAQASYLQIDNAGSANDKFISYDDETTIQKKFDYARSKSIGGLIVWELGGGYRPEQPGGHRDPLLQAVKASLNGTTRVEGGSSEVPLEFLLGQNYPNPFNPTTKIEFHIPSQAFVVLKVYNLLGEEVATLVDGTLQAGSHIKSWDASLYSSGTYIYRLEARTTTGEHSMLTRKLVLLK